MPAEPVPREPSAPPSVPPSSLAPAAPAARPAPSSSASATEASGELAIYKEAHRAHFVAHDYASALAGWDRYLAVAPRGTFALEARYNRAIALHRLGRRAEAIEALRPFADGAYGRYRRDEAQQLIEELR
jgi:TolA-binding protein